MQDAECAEALSIQPTDCQLTCDNRGDAEGQIKHAHHDQLARELIPGYQNGTCHPKDSVDGHCHG